MFPSLQGIKTNLILMGTEGSLIYFITTTDVAISISNLLLII